MLNIISLPPNRVWRTYTGGKSLDMLAGEETPSDSHFPEDWIASLTPATNPGREHLKEEGFSVVSLNGEKILLKQLIEKDPEKILGSKHFRKYGISTSFLLKFLDSAIRLHIQCHPTVTFAKQFLDSDFGKTEGYYILGTREDVKDPYIFCGFQNPPSKERLKEAIETQDIEFLESCFEKIPVKKGDSFFVPAGFPHAIGEGVFMIEIMEPTDLVVRVEFEKNGYVLPEKARFMGRDIDFALSMIDFTPLSIDTVKSRYFIPESMVGEYGSAKEYEIFNKNITDCFRMNKLVVDGSYALSKDSFYIMIITGGTGRIESGGEEFEVKFGDKFFIPASSEMIHIHSESAIEIILAMPPE